MGMDGEKQIRGADGKIVEPGAGLANKFLGPAESVGGAV